MKPMFVAASVSVTSIMFMRQYCCSNHIVSPGGVICYIIYCVMHAKAKIICICFTHFWPTVLSVEPLVHCVVSSVCNVLYCGETVRPSEKLSEGVNRKSGSKS